MKTYWIRVFERAVVLLKARAELDGDTAYRLARKDVDDEMMRDTPQSTFLGMPVVIDPNIPAHPGWMIVSQPACLICGLPGGHNGLQCPNLTVSGGPHG